VHSRKGRSADRAVLIKVVSLKVFESFFIYPGKFAFICQPTVHGRRVNVSRCTKTLFVHAAHCETWKFKKAVVPAKHGFFRDRRGMHWLRQKFLSMSGKTGSSVGRIRFCGA